MQSARGSERVKSWAAHPAHSSQLSEALAVVVGGRDARRLVPTLLSCVRVCRGRFKATCVIPLLEGIVNVTSSARQYPCVG